MPDLVADIQKAITDAVSGQTAEFINQNLGAKKFLEDRAKRLAQLGAAYVTAKDEDERKMILGDMNICKQSCLNEIMTVTILATAETRSAFKAALVAAIEVLIKALPGIVSAVA